MLRTHFRYSVHEKRQGNRTRNRVEGKCFQSITSGGLKVCVARATFRGKLKVAIHDGK